MIKLVIVLIMLIMIFPHFAFGQPEIFTTLRGGVDSIVWDGKWTFLQEWKPTSEDIVQFNDGNELSVKTGHDRENLYVLLDFITENQFRKFSDYGMICMVANNTMESSPQKGDYCFLVTLGSHNPLTFQGGGYLAITNDFMKVENDPNLIAVGGVSDEHDRYNAVPHTSYEFKIPIKIVGRSDVYGFYAATYDAQTDRVYSWPQNVSNDKFPVIPPPSKWGELISPDKSLPEFPYPMIMILLATIVIIYVSKRHVYHN
jgi:hypothetical protein